jgi:hypothetical protein
MNALGNFIHRLAGGKAAMADMSTGSKAAVDARPSTEIEVGVIDKAGVLRFIVVKSVTRCVRVLWIRSARSIRSSKR